MTVYVYMLSVYVERALQRSTCVWWRLVALKHIMRQGSMFGTWPLARWLSPRLEESWWTRRVKTQTGRQTDRQTDRHCEHAQFRDIVSPCAQEEKWTWCPEESLLPTTELSQRGSSGRSTRSIQPETTLLLGPVSEDVFSGKQQILCD